MFILNIFLIGVPVYAENSTILNTAEDIVRNAEYVEKVNALESMRKVDVADISLKAASEYKKATSK